jgi:hypothetical protein
MRRLRLIGLAAVTVLMASAATHAKEQADARVSVKMGSAPIADANSLGAGTLHYKGKNHPFSIDGVSVSVVGAYKRPPIRSGGSAEGKVYHLKKLEDFDGTYTAAADATPAASGGAGAVTMKNQNGVSITLKTKSSGLKLVLAPDGAKINLTH